MRETVPLFKKFNTLDEEIKHLVESSSLKEKELFNKWKKVDKESLIRAEVRRYSASHPDEILEKGYKMLHSETNEIVLNLSPETHDKKIEELLSILQKRGIKNTLEIIKMFKNPHLEDDFHRFIVQYIKAKLPIVDEKNSREIIKSADYSLFEVVFPLPKNDEEKKPLKEQISLMEQFLSSMVSEFFEKGESVSFEIANPEGSEESAFFISVPRGRSLHLEKQLLAVFPKAKLFEKNDDYNIFNYDGISLGVEFNLHNNPIFPIKTYDQFDFDPLNQILNSFSKIDKNGEGAGFQIIIKSDKKGFVNKYKEALRSLESGIPLKKALNIPNSLFGEFVKTTKEIFVDGIKDMMLGSSEKKEERNERFIEEIKKKLASSLTRVNIRIIASSKDRSRTEAILGDIVSSFAQFDNPLGNSLYFEKISEKNFIDFSRKFSWRLFDESTSLPLSLREISSFMHGPSDSSMMPHIKSASSATAPAPINLPKDGTLIGLNKDRNTNTNVFITEEDRLRHIYVIGQTGTGKSSFLKNMIIQDIEKGEGVCMIDPHGSDIDEVLSRVPKERLEDLIYFDPSQTKRPMGLNMLEYDLRFPEQKTFVVNEMLSIFNKLFDMKTAGGPMFEQYFRNSVLLVMEDPETGNTLLDVSRVLANKKFRDMKISRCKNPIVIQFWNDIAVKAGGEASLSNIVPYITSKFDIFLTNDIMRPIVAQEKSAFNFREIMDGKKILLVNLSKGRLGDINAHLLGLIIVGKILMSALSRVDSFGKDLPPFYLYIDEFQNITTNSISQILSEARKYKLSLTVAHQFIAQLEDDIKDAVFGNVGTITSFRVGADDAEYLEKQFEPVFEANDLMNLNNRNAYIKLLVNGKPVRPFSFETFPIIKGNLDIVSKYKEYSFLKYGREKLQIESEIMEKYKKEPPLDLEKEKIKFSPF